VVPRLAATVALLFAATALLAQDAKTVKIEFAGEGERLVWIQAKGEEFRVAETVTGKAFELELPVDTKGKFVYVSETGTGDVALRSLEEVMKVGSWMVKPEDATMAFTVVFVVRHEDKHVSTAVVHMKTQDGERESLLTPASTGLVAFHLVPFGDVEVTVDYKSAGQDKHLAAQTFEVRAGMKSVDYFVLNITDVVETVAPPAEEQKQEAGAGTKKETTEKKEEAPRTNWFATLLNMVIGLAVIGGIAYAVWRYVKANPDETADAFKKAGVAMPGADPGGPAQTPKQAGPPQQIILTDADQTPADTSFVATAAPAVKNPRLVKADGSVYIVMDGEQAVGREEGSGLALAGESSVSRTHAKLTRTGDAVTIEDAGSTNGTFVNGQRLSGPQALSHGDSVQFGAVQVRYEE